MRLRNVSSAQQTQLLLLVFTQAKTTAFRIALIYMKMIQVKLQLAASMPTSEDAHKHKETHRERGACAPL
ncbi:MAG: hypothetical protein DKT66_11110 [Candidatus Melainabacteria bacterium]|nr:MAG: hypothetical protein DKT66_11110 [Candidatus Melainabacteria bacterium]